MKDKGTVLQEQRSYGSDATAAYVAQSVTHDFVHVGNFSQRNQGVALRIDDTQVGTGEDRSFGLASPSPGKCKRNSNYSHRSQSSLFSVLSFGE